MIVVIVVAVRCAVQPGRWTVSEDGGEDGSEAVRAAGPAGDHDAMSGVSGQPSASVERPTDHRRRPAHAVCPAESGACAYVHRRRSITD